MATRGYRRFTLEEKIQMVEEIRAMSAREAAHKLGVSRASITTWRAQEANLRDRPRRSRRVAASPRTSSTPDGTGSTCSTLERQRLLGASSGGADANAPGPVECGIGGHSEQTAQSAARGSADASRGRPASDQAPSADAQPPPSRVSEPAQDRASPQSAERSELDSPTEAPVASPQTPPSPPCTADFLLVGYRGQRGTVADVEAQRVFSLLATDATTAALECKTTGYPRLHNVMSAVENDEIDFGISDAGALLSCVGAELLSSFASRPLKIVAETVGESDLCFCALRGTHLLDCDTIIAGYEDLARCEASIARHDRQRRAPLYRQIAWDSASAYATVRDEDATNIVVIATTQAACAHRLVVLEERIDDGKPVVHLILARLTDSALQLREEAHVPVSGPATTLLAGVQNRPDWLLKLTTVFADLGLDVLRITSRPAVLAPSVYVVCLSATDSSSPPGCAALALIRPRLLVLFSVLAATRLHGHLVLLTFRASVDAAVNTQVLSRLHAVAKWVNTLGTYYTYGRQAREPGS